MAEISIRPARPGDATHLGEIGLASWRKGIAPLVDPDTHARIDADAFAAFVRNSAPEILVAEVAGDIAGFAGSEYGDHRITDLWVRPDREGRGVGSALLAAIEARLTRRGVGTAEIEVMTANRRALRLYRCLGYEPVWSGLSHDATLLVDLEKTRLRKNLAV